MPIAALAGSLPETAAAVASDRGAFGRRLARYRRLAQRAKEAAETGWFREANDRYAKERAQIAARFGGEAAAASSEQARRLRRTAFERVARAEDAYWDRCTAPMQRAAVALALTPAPDLASLWAKASVMREHELESLGSMPRHPLELLEEDFARLVR